MGQVELPTLKTTDELSTDSYFKHVASFMDIYIYTNIHITDVYIYVYKSFPIPFSRRVSPHPHGPPVLAPGIP